MPKLQIPLFATRMLIAVFLLPWTVMRFVRADAAQGIAGKYYKIGFLPDVAFLAIAAFMALLLLAFTIGFKKRISYGLIFLLHTLGTIMTLPTMLPILTGGEGGQILFFAALPVIGAMWLLYVLRDEDTLLSLK